MWRCLFFFSFFFSISALGLPRFVWFASRFAQCRERWCHHLDPSVNHGNWTQEEDNLLCSLEVGGLIGRGRGACGCGGWADRVVGLMGQGAGGVG